MTPLTRTRPVEVVGRSTWEGVELDNTLPHLLLAVHPSEVHIVAAAVVDDDPARGTDSTTSCPTERDVESRVE